MPALVVAIEGSDFSGKSTICNLIVELLRERNGRDVILRRTEIPSTLVSGTFSKILRNSADEVSSGVFALAYAADHLHHFEKVISPLKKSKENFIVIQERSLLSTYIYQSIIGNLNLRWVREINKYVKNIPDLTLIIKVDLEELLKRKSLEKRDADKFEVKDHLEKQIMVFHNLPEDLVKEFHVEYVESNKNPMEVAKACVERIQKKVDKFFI